MNRTKSCLLIIFSFLLLYLPGCRSDDSTIVQPNADMQLGKTMGDTGSPVSLAKISNGDMEKGTDGYWNGGKSIQGYTFNYSDAEYVSPSHSLNVDVSNGNSDSFAYWAQTFNAAEYVGKKVIVTVSAKYLNVSGQGVMLVLRGDDTDLPQGSAEAFTTTQRKIVLTGTSDWKTLQVKMDPVPSGIKSFTVYLLLSANSGSAYFDDLSISASEASAPLTDISNGNFETGLYSPDDWWNGSSADQNFEFTWDTNEYLSPNHSAKISALDSGDAFSVWAQTIIADNFVGKKTTLDVFIKGVNISGEGIFIAIRGDDTVFPSGNSEAFATTQGNEKIAGSFEWQKFSVTLEKVPDNIKSLTIYLIYGAHTSGSVYFDDVALNTD